MAKKKTYFHQLENKLLIQKVTTKYSRSIFMFLNFYRETNMIQWQSLIYIVN